MISQYDVTVIVPIYNSESTLFSTLESLEKQKYPIYRVFLVDNNSTDKSSSIMEHYKSVSKNNVVLISHDCDHGLSYSYNECIKLATTELVVTLHSDIVICDNDGLEKLIEPFIKEKDLVATYPLIEFPSEVWDKYGFWQKCLFSRLLNNLHPGRNGMFNCFRRSALLDIGLFDEKTFRTAGEDGDLYQRLQIIGRTIQLDIIVKHLHNIGASFSLKDYIYKENQYAEAGGACFRKNFNMSIKSIILNNTRPILLIGLTIPYIRYFSILLVLFYSIRVTSNVFLNEWRNLRILILPFINTYILFSYSYYYYKGFLTSKQKL
jgi:glycosyltransferase involved in cell wall biosynthesis